MIQRNNDYTKNKKNTRRKKGEYEESVQKHQQAILRTPYAQVIANSLAEKLGNMPTHNHIVYVYSVLKIYIHDKQEGDVDNEFVAIPVDYLFHWMTGMSTKEYTNSKSENYMASVSKSAIDPFKNLIEVTKWNEGYCRHFKIKKEFRETLSKELIKVFSEQNTTTNTTRLERMLDFAPNPTCGKKKALLGTAFKYKDRCNPLTLSTVDKLRNSKFVFDVDFWNNKSELVKFIYQNNNNNSLTIDQMEALISALDDIRMDKKPQYHGVFNLQNPGRLHTSGGAMNLITWFRKRVIKPVNPNNVVLELDLNCAQLIILCDLLKVPEVKQHILEVLDTGESIWDHIGAKTMPKAIKKVIGYGFCFGGSVESLPYLATKRARNKYGLNVSVKKPDVEACLNNSLLAPLLAKREKWMEQYTLKNILAEKTGANSLVFTNALEYKFDALMEAKEHCKKDEYEGKKPEKYKIAGRLLAHLAQGVEQQIIQRFITEKVEVNILTYSYDGMSLEVEPTKIQHLKQEYDAWIKGNFSDFSFKYEEYS